MKSLPIYTVDSFTNQPFKGNPAGVCILEQPLEMDTMLSIAQELNLSETAFLLKKEEHIEIQYFSPIKEIPLCGHATLASAKILLEERGLNEVLFVTNSQVNLKAKKIDDQIGMEFPSFTTSRAEASNELLKALGISEVLDARYNKENNILMLVIKEEELEALRPDFNALLQAHDSISGVLITASSKGEYDFKSRYFWPWSGGNEDPVTGATHTFMAPYWGEQLKMKSLKSFQSSKRSGSMDIELLDNDKIMIKGSAVIVIKGTLTL